MAERDVILAIDAGTSTIKALAFSADGAELAAASVRNTLEYGGGGAVEQDMDATRSACLAVLRDLVENRPGLSAQAAAIVVTGQGDGTWLIGRDGQPVGRALTWLDGRSGALVRNLSAALVAEVQRITGTALSASLQSAQLCWLRRHEPGRLARAAAALHCKDWLFYCLTGTIASDLSESLFTFGDYATGIIDGRVFELLGIPELRHLVPATMAPLTDRAHLAPAIARELSLPSGLPVILAPIDVVCSALGSGALDGAGFHPCSIFGSAGAHLRFAAHPPEPAPPVAGYTTQLAPQRLWVRYLSNMAASLNLDWLADLIADAGAAIDPARCAARPSEAQRFAAIDRLAASGRSSGLLYFPYLFPAGERAPFVNPDARAQFVGLGREHRLGDLVRAVYEGIGFAAKDCHARLGDADEIRISGGLARSETFHEILTEIYGVPTRRCLREETGAAGAAMVAAVNLGRFRDLGGAGEAWAAPWLGTARRPDAARAAAYRTLFEIYRRAGAASGPAWAALRQFDGGDPL